MDKAEIIEQLEKLVNNRGINNFGEFNRRTLPQHRDLLENKIFRAVINLSIPHINEIGEEIAKYYETVADSDQEHLTEKQMTDILTNLGNITRYLKDEQPITRSRYGYLKHRIHKKHYESPDNRPR
ncbi:MAG: hypothetical protein WC438_00165 [Candidatus Pacearchaeota archaeon]